MDLMQGEGLLRIGVDDGEKVLESILEVVWQHDGHDSYDVCMTCSDYCSDDRDDDNNFVEKLCIPPDTVRQTLCIPLCLSKRGTLIMECRVPIHMVHVSAP